MGRAGGAAGLPAAAMALDDGSDVLGGDAVQMQVRLSARQAARERAVALLGTWRCSERGAPAAGRCGTGPGTSWGLAVGWPPEHLAV